MIKIYNGFIGTVLLSAACFAQANEQQQTEQQCQQQLDRFVGMQNHVRQQSNSSVPTMAVGFSSAEIERLSQQQGYCATWQQLIVRLQQQHSTILDKTEQKTGQPAPKR
ncbi:hypothetical protein IC617_02980 [Neiella sp. HB171785]|uniref:Secreted protein n=1 Tax=Neiella litorisoli TaxID=2771431 RepID=A0A8J6UPH2_9GAMM|nr:hypothetical protein [Neiella litorisoli]MBD1388382.1 hypothetical protein [Neiella litorisoli]